MIRYIQAFTLVLVACCSLQAMAQGEARISPLTPVDRQFMQQQRDLLLDLVERNYGRVLKREKDNDLDLIQRLLDDQLVRNDQPRELQAMGVAMGDLLAQDLGLHWVIFEDSLGRSRALRYKESDDYLFPVTMISRRREVDNRTPVTQIYQKAVDAIAPAIPPKPFQ